MRRDTMKDTMRKPSGERRPSFEHSLMLRRMMKSLMRLRDHLMTSLMRLRDHLETMATMTTTTIAPDEDPPRHDPTEPLLTSPP